MRFNNLLSIATNYCVLKGRTKSNGWKGLKESDRGETGGGGGGERVNGGNGRERRVR